MKLFDRPLIALTATDKDLICIDKDLNIGHYPLSRDGHDFLEIEGPMKKLGKCRPFTGKVMLVAQRNDSNQIAVTLCSRKGEAEIRHYDVPASI